MFEGLLSRIDQLLLRSKDGGFLDGQKRNDVVHDFLAHLSAQMTEMNKSRIEEIRDFLKWLEREIRTEIETLTNKTKLKGYYDLEFEGLSDILKQNRRKLPINPSNREFQENLKGEFIKSINVLDPLRRRIKATDKLIDEIVYRLYGLSEEEIGLIEGSA